MINNLILASTSSYRASLLRQLGLEFKQIDPEIKESEQPGESPLDCAIRLARLKSQAGAEFSDTQDNALILGSDQVAYMGSTIFPKPGDFESAFDQLTRCSGCWVSFSTAVCLVTSLGDVAASGVDTFKIKYRQLTPEAIKHYLITDQPFDCAGSIKAEGLGVTLIQETSGNDVNTLYGLPLILLVDLLNSAGFDIINSIN
ncbi:MAG TPA: Maf family protein, partial [Pseudomonadales bacterium]|mgnify:CR=1 FL=1|jgi:septum formation protein|nr:Maf family protein [Pseudomonadales bacterium]MDP6316650.1 Maf family protein [Pseudomonadales bacterium]MDP7576727.1 Maf family protein [Pseudomonadales bacterium]HJL62075.1 Maf family protein [Pseudomonadales bacterium]HJP51867.1 Maf family protein [Pseudomonadales bacterium]|tara:strand:+ start:282 stop:884 length:603 start_codon:yes stop_codon:yes gene_type:complete